VFGSAQEQRVVAYLKVLSCQLFGGTAETTSNKGEKIARLLALNRT
jgi:hypothetical protein